MRNVNQQTDCPTTLLGILAQVCLSCDPRTGQGARILRDVPYHPRPDSMSFSWQYFELLVLTKFGGQANESTTHATEGPPSTLVQHDARPKGTLVIGHLLRSSLHNLTRLCHPVLPNSTYSADGAHLQCASPLYSFHRCTETGPRQGQVAFLEEVGEPRFVPSFLVAVVHLSEPYNDAGHMVSD